MRPDVTLATVQRYLRLRGQIPENTDKLFVTDRRKPAAGGAAPHCRAAAQA